VKSGRSKNPWLNMNMNKLSLFVGTLMALFIVNCKVDRTAPGAVFINPLANPKDRPPAGNTSDNRIDNSVIRNNIGGSL
jgi:hypothetical protein